MFSFLDQVPFSLKLNTYKKSTFEEIHHLKDYPTRVKARGGWVFAELRLDSPASGDVALGPIDCFMQDTKNKTNKIKVMESR